MSDKPSVDVFDLNDPALTPPKDPLFPSPGHLSAPEKQVVSDFFAPLFEDFLNEGENAETKKAPAAPEKFSLRSLFRFFRAKKK